MHRNSCGRILLPLLAKKSPFSSWLVGPNNSLMTFFFEKEAKACLPLIKRKVLGF
jgi:hypothetical protein